MSEVKNKYRYELTDRFGTMDVAPLGEGDFSIKYNRETDGKYFYSKTFQGKITFTGEIFKRLKRIERSIYICTTQRLKVFRKCNAGEMLIFDGFFKLTEGDWDDDKCRVTLKFEKNTPDKCLKDNKSKKINLLAEINPKITVKTSTAGGGVFEYKHCNANVQVSPSTPYGGYVWCGSGSPEDGNWQVYQHEEMFDGNIGISPDPNTPPQGLWTANTSYVREIVELFCSEIPPAGWVLLEDNCATTGKKKYAKNVTLYDCKYTSNYQDQNNYSSSYECKILGATNESATIDNGMELNKIIELFVNQFCADVQVVSDFFQINPTTGKNLLQNSNTFFDNNDYPISTYPITETIEQGTTVTVQIWGQLAAGKIWWIYNSGGGAYIGTITEADYIDGRYVKTMNWNKFNSDGSLTANNTLFIYPYAPNGANSQITKIKLEKGSVGTEWQPDNGAINYVTGEPTQVDNLILFQKSDVKRPNVSGNAWKAEWTFDKLMETLNILFNVSYSLENGVFRLEHISWFSRNAGLNLTLPAFQKWTKGKRKYSYDVGDIPIRENWKFKEAINYAGGWNTQIDYAGACAIGSNENAEKNYVIDELTTDVQLCLDNPSSDSNVVEDLGFVLIATKKYNGEYFIITEADATYGTRLNNSLSFNKLVRRYHFHNRPLNKGILNGDNVTFITTKPIKKGEKLTVPLCCETTFNPNDTVTTDLGVGIVDGAQFNLSAETLELDLLYNVFDTLINNQAPQLAGGAYSTYQNVPIVIPLNAVDSDGVITEISIKNQAYHGTVEVLSLTEIKYTPNAGYTGWDSFSLVAFDDWSEVSNVAGFGITVYPPNQPPTAQNDSYNVYHGEQFNAQISVFDNDSDDLGFTLVNSNIVTALGVNIVIDGNGRFSYVPPAGFEGVDTFQYSIVDNAGLTSTATVTLNIAYKNKPIAVADNYITQKDTQLVTNGTAGKEALFANDYTPDGQTYAYTCNVENKATTAGGTVQIQANGLFTYTPPANFTGQDTFTYTVNNVNGSGVGNVTINVIPTIYVRIAKSDHKFEYQILFCGDPPMQTIGGQNVTNDFTLYFYADAAKTIPYNVTGLNFKCNIKITTQWYDSGGTQTWDYTDQTEVLTGTSHKIFDDYYTQEQYMNCNGTYDYNVERTVELVAGSYVIVT